MDEEILNRLPVHVSKYIAIFFHSNKTWYEDVESLQLDANDTRVFSQAYPIGLDPVSAMLRLCFLY